MASMNTKYVLFREKGYVTATIIIRKTRSKNMELNFNSHPMLYMVLWLIHISLIID